MIKSAALPATDCATQRIVNADSGPDKTCKVENLFHQMSDFLFLCSGVVEGHVSEGSVRSGQPLPANQSGLQGSLAARKCVSSSAGAYRRLDSTSLVLQWLELPNELVLGSRSEHDERV